jgi:transcriptional regulator with XRE-family HTH domain
MDAKAIGRTVRWARKRAGMTQHDLAEATGLPQPSIARIERGTVIPRTATLIAILSATGHRLTVEPLTPAVDRKAIARHLSMPIPRRTRQAFGSIARDQQASPVRILRRLRLFGVPFVLVGELAEVAHGSPAKIGHTIEVCVAATDVARERLGIALDDLGAAAEGDRLRVLTETAAEDGYDALLPNAVTMPVESGIAVRVAALEDLIRIRRAGRTPEDQEAAAVLDAIVEEGLARPER